MENPMTPLEIQTRIAELLAPHIEALAEKLMAPWRAAADELAAVLAERRAANLEVLAASRELLAAHAALTVKLAVVERLTSEFEAALTELRPGHDRRPQ
jgi:hypothetical protein